MAEGAFTYHFSGSAPEAAQVIADELLQLRKLAQQSDMRFLSYLLEMAFREAFMASVTPSVSQAAAGKSAASRAG